MSIAVLLTCLDEILCTAVGAEEAQIDYCTTGAHGVPPSFVNAVFITSGPSPALVYAVTDTL